MSRADNNATLGLLAIVGTIVFWGSAFTGIRVGLDSYGAGELALFRFATASATLFLIQAMRGFTWPDRIDLRRLIAISLIGITGYHLLLNFGQRVVPPLTASLLIQIAPVFTALLAVLFDGEKVSRAEWAGIGVAATGAAILVLGRGEIPGFTGGALLIVVAALATACYFVFQRPLARKHGVIAVTSWSIWIGTIPMLAWAPTLVQQMGDASAASIGAAVYIGVLPAALAYLMWNFAISTFGAARTSVALYIVPIVAFATDWAWYDRVPTVMTVVGGVIAIGGVVWVSQVRRRASVST